MNAIAIGCCGRQGVLQRPDSLDPRLMNGPLISIIVNVYNGERYLEECLDSIRRLQGEFSLQVIVVDDASSDGTAEILRRYVDAGFEIVALAENVGAAAAINHAFTLIRGEFVARIDYDDRYHPNFLIDSVDALERQPDAAFVCAAVRMINSEGVPSVTTGPADYGEEAGCHDRFASMLERHFVTAPTILGRTSHWLRAIPIPAGMNFCDWYMNLTMAETAPVVVIDKVVADYRVHPLNMHSTKVRDGMGERVTLQVLDRFLYNSPRSAELALHACAIKAMHYVDWGNNYFGARMDADALRCYRAALHFDPTQFWKGRFMHRCIGLLVGRTLYERVKRMAHLSGLSRLWT
jgi:glycosyltransferase involved in cell wall biosynthesis